MLLADKLFGHLIPPRFFFFAIVGGAGLLIHMATLATALHIGFDFRISQIIAVVTRHDFKFCAKQPHNV